MSRPTAAGLASAVNVSLLVAALAVAALIAETAIRWLAPQQLILKSLDVWRPDSTLGHRHTANARVTLNTGERTVRFITDAAGFRVGDAGRRPGDKTLLLLGDSVMEALQVEYEASLAGQLEARLSRSGGQQVAVHNTAVGGWAPDQYYLQALQSLRSGERYDLVLVALYLDNDVVEFRRDRVPPRVPAQVHRFRLPRSWRPAEFIDAVFYPINDVLEVRSELFVFLKNRFETVRMRVGLAEAEFGAHYYTSQRVSARWQNTADICVDIARAASAHGAPTVFVLIPASFQVDSAILRQYRRAYGIDERAVDLSQPQRIMTERLRERGLDVIDASSALREAYARGAFPYGRVDRHLSAEVHARLAGLLEPVIRRLLQLPQPRTGAAGEVQ